MSMASDEMHLSLSSKQHVVVVVVSETGDTVIQSVCNQSATSNASTEDKLLQSINLVFLLSTLLTACLPDNRITDFATKD